MYKLPKYLKNHNNENKINTFVIVFLIFHQTQTKRKIYILTNIFSFVLTKIILYKINMKIDRIPQAVIIHNQKKLF